MSALVVPPEHNVTGIDYAERGHLRYAGAPIVDFHAHVMLTQPGDVANAPPGPLTTQASTDQAALLFEVADTFGVGPVVTMCPVEHIPQLRERFGARLIYNGFLSKKKADDPDDDAYRLLDQYLAEGIRLVKYWSAPRGRDRGLIVDAPWRIEATRRALAAGVRLFMVHVGDPDAWFRTMYTDTAKFGTKPDQYVGLRRMLELFPEATWIGAHMGGDVEHPDHLQELIERYPHFYLDTSATKWQVREVSPRRDAVRALVCRYPERFLFGSDLVTRHGLTREHYVSRYWCQRTLWESRWEGPSPIADPDHKAEDGATTPQLRGVGLPPDVLELVYHRNAARLLGAV